MEESKIRTAIFGPEVSTDGLKDEPHGPLISFSYNCFSHGMMAGSSSSSGESLDWNRDGSITLTVTGSGGGKSTKTEYRVRPEIAEKLRGYTAEKHLAALSKEKIRTPEVYDSFTSSAINMVFDDSSIGGSSYESCSIQCGPAGMTFGTIESEVSKILKECRETGECVFSEEKEAGGAFGGFPGMMGTPGMMGIFGTMGIQDTGTGTPAPAGTGAAPEMKPGEPWTCSSCGHTGNKGRFCDYCALPRQSSGPAAAGSDGPPAKPMEMQPGCWTCTVCGYTGNGGKFCAQCGSRR